MGKKVKCLNRWGGGKKFTFLRKKLTPQVKKKSFARPWSGRARIYTMLFIASLVRTTVVTAMKFTITDQPQPIDALLKTSIGNYN